MTLDSGAISRFKIGGGVQYTFYDKVDCRNTFPILFSSKFYFQNQIGKIS